MSPSYDTKTLGSPSYRASNVSESTLVDNSSRSIYNKSDSNQAGRHAKPSMGSKLKEKLGLTHNPSSSRTPADPIKNWEARAMSRV
ncbi:hypothetical protein G7046_g9133 [Stylonectria norvegica]|nr:hypothetical protein G7046_g9133 [Stylonectria norvegica]